MERRVVRINGTVERLHRVTDEELGGYLFYAAERLAQAQADIDNLQGELHRRFNVELPMGEIAIEKAMEPDTFEHDPFIDGLSFGYDDRGQE